LPESSFSVLKISSSETWPLRLTRVRSSSSTRIRTGTSCAGGVISGKDYNRRDRVRRAGLLHRQRCHHLANAAHHPRYPCKIQAVGCVERAVIVGISEHRCIRNHDRSIENGLEHSDRVYYSAGLGETRTKCRRKRLFDIVLPLIEEVKKAKGVYRSPRRSVISIKAITPPEN